MLDHLKLPLRIGLYGGLTALYFCLIGMVETFAERGIISGVLTLGGALLIITGLGTGYLTIRLVARALAPPGQAPSREVVPVGRALIAGLIPGLMVGLTLVIFVILADNFNLRAVLVNVSPKLINILTFDRGVTSGALLQLLVSGVVLGGIGSLVFVLPGQISRPLLWGLAMVLLVGMLSELIRITLSRPGWPTALSRYLLVLLRGLTIQGAVTVFVLTGLLVLASPYLPGLYRAVLRRLMAWLPGWFRWAFVGILSFWLALRLIYFTGIAPRDLPLLPACGQRSPAQCVGNLGQMFRLRSEASTSLQAAEPIIVGLITVAELLLLPGGVIALVLLLVRGIRRSQVAVAERQDHLPSGEMLGHVQRYTNAYIGFALLLFAPILLGSFPSEVMVNIGLYVVMGFGLNIVVGFAGLLDLGYVAFFAVGAYSTAILTSPASVLTTNVEGWEPLTFWQALPFVFVITAISGLFVGAPVLRMRGDYLAIVTLGLGEIARFLALSDWLSLYLGGAQGILNIPRPQVGGAVFDNPQKLFYLLLAGSLAALFISWRLKDSRVGRAWVAMREDEDVADAMGINTIAYKLLAFGMGATIASYSGAIFVAKLGAVFPHSFNVLVSITALSLLIIGGIGSLPGVVVGAVALVGIPELLREFSEYRLLIYGALLIIMMLVKPEGFIPDRRRTRELHEDEQSQDDWLEIYRPAPEPAD